jgi:hypothetical protein
MANEQKIIGGQISPDLEITNLTVNGAATFADDYWIWYDTTPTATQVLYGPNQILFSIPSTTKSTLNHIDVFNSFADEGTDPGFGVGFEFKARNAATTSKTIGYLDYVYTDTTNGSEDVILHLKGIKAGSVVTGLTMIGKDTIIGRGDIDGFAIVYSSTTAVGIKAGKCATKDKYYILETDTTHTMTSLATGFDHHYIYIDDSASTSGGAPVIIDTTTEPVWSDDNKGWYNGDDRCLGSVVSPSTGATVAYFSTTYNAKEITYHYGVGDFADIALNMNPDSTWQTPNVTESSVLVPVMATAIRVFLDAADTDANCTARAASNEMAAVNTIVTNGDINVASYARLHDNGWVILGSSRNIKVAGTNDDDNALTCRCMGFKIKI